MIIIMKLHQYTNTREEIPFELTGKYNSLITQLQLKRTKAET